MKKESEINIENSTIIETNIPVDIDQQQQQQEEDNQIAEIDSNPKINEIEKRTFNSSDNRSADNILNKLKNNIDLLNRQLTLQQKCIQTILNFNRLINRHLNDGNDTQQEQQQEQKESMCFNEESFIIFKKEYKNFNKRFKCLFKKCKNIERKNQKPSHQIYQIIYNLFKFIDEQNSLLNNNADDDNNDSYRLIAESIVKNVAANKNTKSKLITNNRTITSQTNKDKRNKSNNIKTNSNSNNNNNKTRKYKRKYNKKKRQQKQQQQQQKHQHQQQDQQQDPQHQQQEKKLYKCKFPGCGFSSPNFSLLGYHNLKHTNERPFACTICDKAYRFNYDLQYHIRGVHQNIRSCCPYEGCTAKFLRPNSLKKHMLIHTGDVQRCEWPGCDYQTHKKDLFRKHQTKHTGERNYPCTWPNCGKAFKTNSALFDHVLIHKNERKYICTWPDCTYRCNTSGNLKKHMLIHENKALQNKSNTLTRKMANRQTSNMLNHNNNNANNNDENDIKFENLTSTSTASNDNNNNLNTTLAMVIVPNIHSYNL